MVKLIPFSEADFDLLISWVDNEELLMTIAGPMLSFPLTKDQLLRYLQNEKSHSFTVADESGNKIGHAEVVESGQEMFKIDKLIIGKQSNRGKGIGEQVMKELMKYAFTELGAKTVELNVFDWNIAGIRCYEKCGFTINPEKRVQLSMGDKNWTVLNMSVDKAG